MTSIIKIELPVEEEPSKEPDTVMENNEDIEEPAKEDSEKEEGEIDAIMEESKVPSSRKISEVSEGKSRKSSIGNFVSIKLPSESELGEQEVKESEVKKSSEDEETSLQVQSVIEDVQEKVELKRTPSESKSSTSLVSESEESETSSQETPKEDSKVGLAEKEKSDFDLNAVLDDDDDDEDEVKEEPKVIPEKPKKRSRPRTRSNDFTKLMRIQ